MAFMSYHRARTCRAWHSGHGVERQYEGRKASSPPALVVLVCPCAGSLPRTFGLQSLREHLHHAYLVHVEVGAGDPLEVGRRELFGLVDDLAIEQ